MLVWLECVASVVCVRAFVRACMCVCVWLVCVTACVVCG